MFVNIVQPQPQHCAVAAVCLECKNVCGCLFEACTTRGNLGPFLTQRDDVQSHDHFSESFPLKFLDSSEIFIPKHDPSLGRRHSEKRRLLRNTPFLGGLEFLRGKFPILYIDMNMSFLARMPCCSICMVVSVGNK